MEKTKDKNQSLCLIIETLSAVLKKNVFAIFSITIFISLACGYYLSEVKPIHRIDVNITSDYDRSDLFGLYMMLPYLFNNEKPLSNSSDYKFIEEYKQKFHIDAFDTLYYLEENIFSVKIIMSQFDKSTLVAEEFVQLLNNSSFAGDFIQNQLKKRDMLINTITQQVMAQENLDKMVKNLKVDIRDPNFELFRLVNKTVPYQNYTLKQPNVMVSVFALFVTTFIAVLLLFAHLNLRKEEKSANL
jgi:hypothetical protein